MSAKRRNSNPENIVVDVSNLTEAELARDKKYMTKHETELVNKLRADLKNKKVNKSTMATVVSLIIENVEDTPIKSGENKKDFAIKLFKLVVQAMANPTDRTFLLACITCGLVAEIIDTIIAASKGKFLVNIKNAVEDVVDDVAKKTKSTIRKSMKSINITMPRPKVRFFRFRCCLPRCCCCKTATKTAETSPKK
jgi:hypothetical protein